MKTIEFKINSEIATEKASEILKRWCENKRDNKLDNIFGGYSERYEILVLTIYKNISEEESILLKKLETESNLTLRTDFGDGVDYEFWGTNTDLELEKIDDYLSKLDRNKYCFHHYLSDTGMKIYNFLETMEQLTND